MRIILFTTVLIAVFTSANAMDFEQAVTPHGMIYFSVPFGAQGAAGNHTSFGFRIDNIRFAQRGIVDYGQLAQRPAVIDFRMNVRGVEGVYLSGTDYLQLYNVNRQNQEQGNEAGTPAPEAGETISEALSELPLGAYIGVGLGIGLLLGVGD